MNFWDLDQLADAMLMGFSREDLEDVLDDCQGVKLTDIVKQELSNRDKREGN